MRCKECLKKHGPSKHGLNYIFTCAVCGKKLGEDKKPETVLSNSTDWLCAGYLIEWGNASVFRYEKEDAERLKKGVNDDAVFTAKITPLFKKTSTRQAHWSKRAAPDFGK